MVPIPAAIAHFHGARMKAINMAGIIHINTVGLINAIARSATAVPNAGNRRAGNFKGIHCFAAVNSSRQIVQITSTPNIATVPQRAESGKKSCRPNVIASRKTKDSAIRRFAVAQGSDSGPLANVNWGEGKLYKF